MAINVRAHATCPCGYRFSKQSWERHVVGVQVFPAGEGEPETHLELANCPVCGSTAAREIGATETRRVA